MQEEISSYITIIKNLEDEINAFTKYPKKEKNLIYENSLLAQKLFRKENLLKRIREMVTQEQLTQDVEVDGA